MYKKFTIAALIVSMSLCSCATTVPVHEAREYGMDRIDRITLNTGKTHDYELDSIDEATNKVIGRTRGRVLEYRKEDIQYFQSTKPGLTLLAGAGIVIAFVAIVFAATWDGISMEGFSFGRGGQ